VRQISRHYAKLRCVSRRNTPDKTSWLITTRTVLASRGSPASGCFARLVLVHLPPHLCDGHAALPVNCTRRGLQFMSNHHTRFRKKIKRGYLNIWRLPANSARKSSLRRTTTLCAAFCESPANKT